MGKRGRSARAREAAASEQTKQARNARWWGFAGQLEMEEEDCRRASNLMMCDDTHGPATPCTGTNRSIRNHISVRFKFWMLRQCVPSLSHFLTVSRPLLPTAAPTAERHLQHQNLTTARAPAALPALP